MSNATLRRTALFALVGVALFTVGISLGYIFSSLQIVALPPAHQNEPSSAEAMVLKAQLDYLERRIDDLERLASVLLLFSTLFAAVAGISTYINVGQAVEKAGTLVKTAEESFSQAKSKADSAIERLDRELAAVRSRADVEITEIRREFPMFGYMNHVIARIVGEFTTLLDQEFLTSGSSGRVDMFGQLSSEKRQRVFFYEKSVAALALMDMRAYSGDMAKIYRGLGIFFGSRAYSFRDGVNEDDLEKAVFYFERANRVDAESAPVYNDMAFFIIDERRPPSWPRAEQILNRSLDLLDNQQRARLILSYISIKRKEYTKALEILKAALARSSWETGNDTPRHDKIHYNCACALAGMGRFGEAIKHLEDSFVDARRDLWETLRSDLSNPDDEINRLAGEKECAARIRSIVERCERLFGAVAG